MNPKRGAIVGFDIGTSSLKVAAFDSDTGIFIDAYTWSYDLEQEKEPGIIPVRVYEQSLAGALRELAEKYEIISIAITTQLYSILRKTPRGLLAYQWNTLWKPGRAADPEMKNVLIRSGCRPDTLYPAYKLATLPEDARADFLPYGIKEHLTRMLTGELVTDYSTASAFGVFDATDRKWNTSAVEALGIDARALPAAVSHDTAIGRVMGEILPKGKTIVAPGLGDGPAASYACRDESLFCGNLGSSMAARMITQTPDFSDKIGLWNYALDETRFVTGGMSPNSCTVLNWAGDMGLDTGSTCLDSREARFFPWLHGERMPFWSGDLRGTFTGLEISDNAETIYAATVKSVAFTFCRMALALEHLTAPDSALVLAGGGTGTRPLLRVIAGCLHRDLVLLENETYLGGFGAGMSAAAAAGLSISPELRIKERIRPSGEFEEEYATWAKMADNIAGIYR